MRPRPIPTRRPKALGGFTIVELLVAVALGLLLLGALITLVVSTIGNRTELDKTSRQVESGRYALQVLSTDIESAGFVGTTGDQTWERGAAPSLSSGGRSFTLAVCPASVAELGYDAPTGTPAPAPLLPLAVQMLETAPTCLSTANVKPGTAMLLITRVSSQEVLTTAASTSEAYVQISTCGNDSQPLAIGLGGGSAFSLHQKDCATLAPLRKVIHRIYFISTCNECATGKNDGIPTLKVVEYAGGAMSSTPTPLADGIDDLQLDYGVDMGTGYNGSPDCYISKNYAETPVFVTDDAAICPTPASYQRKDVVTVRINLLARTAEKPSGWKDDGRTFSLGLAKPSVGPFNDGYRRMAYSTVARIVNISALRETP